MMYYPCSKQSDGGYIQATAIAFKFAPINPSKTGIVEALVPP